MVLSDIAQKAFSGFSSSSTTTTVTTTAATTTTSFWPTPDGLTLEMVLADQTPEPFSRKDFVHYLKISYCNENLLFYEAVTEYKDKCAAYFGLNPKETKPTNVLLSDGVTQFDFTSTNANGLSPREKLWFETLKHKFEQILQDFVLSDAPQEINIPYEVRHQLLESYQSRQLYHPAILYPAYSAVIELLRISAFIPFATDPNRLYCPLMKTSKKLSFKKQKSTTNLVSPPQSPPLPSPPLPESASTGLLKRFTTSLKIRYNNQDTSGPVSPTTPRLSNWRQINIPDLSPFKSTSTPPSKQPSLPPLPPPKQSNNTTEKSFTIITPPPSTLTHNQSSISTISRRNSSSSSISSSSDNHNSTNTNNII